MSMNPILRYYGAKWRIAQWIISHMPPHRTYIEPFAGSCAVLLNKDPAEIETINDIDGEVANFFEVLRDWPDELSRSVNLTPWARQEFVKSREPVSDPVERARRFACACWMSMGSRISGRPTGFRRTCAGQGSNMAALWGRVPETLLEAAIRLKQVQIENRDAVKLIREYNAPDVLIYADPPYIGDERTNKDEYRHEMTHVQHLELTDALRAHSGMVLLSGYRNPIYDGCLIGWKKITVKTYAERGAARTECLWINPLAVEKKMEQQEMAL
jgi:DNA adenine methylase